MIKPQLSTHRFSWRMAVAISPFVVGGLTLVACANFLPKTEPPTQIVLSEATATENQIVPTDVPLPTATLTSVPPTDTLPPPTATPTPEPMLTTNTSANVRSGPGTNYPPIGSLPEGGTAKVIGLDSSGHWYVIEFEAADNGRGWVSDQVSTYNGDVTGLSVIAAPPPPLPTATPIPPTAAPKPTSASKHGLTGRLTLCDPKTNYAVSVERICFKELIYNGTTSRVNYGVLGVLAMNLSGGPNQFQTSWSGDLAIDPSCYGPTDRCGGKWEDGMKISVVGSYRLLMQICYSPQNDCGNSTSEWETLGSAGQIQVVS
jgi:hypothetical protein